MQHRYDAAHRGIDIAALGGGAQAHGSRHHEGAQPAPCHSGVRCAGRVGGGRRSGGSAGGDTVSGVPHTARVQAARAERRRRPRVDGAELHPTNQSALRNPERVRQLSFSLFAICPPSRVVPLLPPRPTIITPLGWVGRERGGVACIVSSGGGCVRAWLRSRVVSSARRLPAWIASPLWDSPLCMVSLWLPAMCPLPAPGWALRCAPSRRPPHMPQLVVARQGRRHAGVAHVRPALQERQPGETAI